MQNIIAPAYKQDNEYSCGAFALAFFLSLHGFKTSPAEMKRLIDPSKNWGTAPLFMERVLQSLGLKYNAYEDGEEYVVPLLVNVTANGDGHWGVIVARTDEYVSWYDPATGRIEVTPRSEFNVQWYSEGSTVRYGIYLE
jgi:ABC-type bacteriocin/lantibiotic exporter with double-glycine peptidase domain